jgi:hypothetical protein
LAQLVFKQLITYLAILKVLFFLLVSIFLSISSIHARTYYGCVSNDTGLIYVNEAYGNTYEPTNAQTPGVGNYCGPQYVGSCRIRTRSQCNGCGPKINEGTSKNPDYWYYQPGNEYSYVACPIDDYIPAALLLVGSTGFLFIRRRVGQPVF